MKSFAFVLLFGYIGTMFAATVLVESARPMAEIVIPAAAGPVEQFAAQELQRHVERVSKAKLPIVREDQITGTRYRVWVGHTSTAAAAGLDTTGLPESGYMVKTAGGGLFLLGHDTEGSINNPLTATGTLYAVYRFLEEQLKIRWLWPDDDNGTVYPPADTITVNEYDLTGGPAFANVRIRRLPLLWLRRAGRVHFYQVQYAEGHGGHAFSNWYKEFGVTHPEWFAHTEGQALKPVERITAMCVSNPEFHREIVRRWDEARRKNPDKQLVINCCENDTPGNCACARCLSWDGPDRRFSFLGRRSDKNVGERYARFYLEVWKLASQIDPDVKVYGYAYSNYIYAPAKTRLNRNIVISMVPPADAADFPRSPEIEQEITDNLQGWIRSGATLNYRPNIFGGYAMPENFVAQYYREFQLMRQAGMQEIDIDGPNTSFATQGPLLYVMGRLMAYPDAKLETLLDEYYQGFGPAADEVKNYWEYWQNYCMANARKFSEIPTQKNPLRFSSFFGFHYAFYAHELFPQESFEPARSLMAQAAEQVKNDPEYRKKVEFLSAGLEHARLCADACSLFADKSSVAERKLNAMNKVQSFRQTSLPEWAADVKFFTSNGRNENVAWQFNDFDPNAMIQLPLEWRFMVDPENQGETRKYHLPEYNTETWRTVTTDRHLELQDIRNYRHAWYRLEFTVPDKFKTKRTILRLGAVDESCDLWINGRKAGSFRYDPAIDPDSWKKPLEFDITGFLHASGPNLIALKVINESGNGGLWQPSQIRFFDNIAAINGDSAYFQANKTKFRGMDKYIFLEKEPGGQTILKMVGNGQNLYSGFRLPFTYPANKSFEFNAEIKLENREKGYFSIILIEFGAANKELKYHPLKLDKNSDWLKLNCSFKTTPDTNALGLTIMSRELNENACGYVKNFLVKPL